jgi:Ca2+-binding EF-hand superfamily protein
MQKEKSMLMARRIIAFILITLAAGSMASDALGQRVSRRTAASAARDVQNLMRMMDADQNGAVSKEEFMNFMSQTFDRLDVNKSGTLETNEMRSMTNPTWLLGVN